MLRGQMFAWMQVCYNCFVFLEIDGVKQEEKDEEGNVLFSKNSSRLLLVTRYEIP